MGNTIEVIPTEVKITPNGEIAWHATDFRDGTLYTPTPKDATADDPAILFSHYLEGNSSYEKLGQGGEGIVFDVEGYALKHYNHSSIDDLWPNKFGLLPDLRANIALTEGLSRAEQMADLDYDVRGVEIHAAYIPRSSDEPPQILWLMEKLHSSGNLYGDCLNSQERARIRRLYNSALTLVNVHEFAVDYDDGFDEGNTMVTYLPTSSSRGELVKYDSYAYDDWLNF